MTARAFLPLLLLLLPACAPTLAERYGSDPGFETTEELIIHNQADPRRDFGQNIGDLLIVRPIAYLLVRLITGRLPYEPPVVYLKNEQFATTTATVGFSGIPPTGNSTYSLAVNHNCRDINFRLDKTQIRSTETGKIDIENRNSSRFASNCQFEVVGTRADGRFVVAEARVELY